MIRPSFALFLLLLGTTLVTAQTRYFVKVDGVSHEGTSWSLAFGDLQEAIDSAQIGDEIWVKYGSYYPTRELDGNEDLNLEAREKSFYVAKEISLLGGFQGTESLAAERNWSINPTILSGDLGQLEDSLDNAFHVVWIDGTSSPINTKCIIDGFIIEGGNANGPGIHESGAALYNLGNGGEASPLIKNCVIRDNRSNYGGSFYNSGREGISSPKIENCRFLDNMGSNGSAMFCNGYMGMSNPSVIDCVFERNIATHSGGAIFLFANQGTCGLTIQGSIFTDNEAELGGAIAAFESAGLSSSRLVNCLFWGNEASRYGGALYHSGQDHFGCFILNCTFSNNRSGVLGGAIKNFNAACDAVNTIFWNNEDEIVNNTQSHATLLHCIFDDGNQNNAIALPSGVTNLGMVTDQDPSFISSIDNARLRQISAAVDAGTSDTTGLFLRPHDLDGQPRINGVVDIGCFENPFVNCPKWIKMQNDYSPLSGPYLAQDSIVISAGVVFEGDQEIILEAPVVQIAENVCVRAGTELLVTQTGCMPP